MPEKKYTQMQVNEALFEAYEKFKNSDVTSETFIGKLECLKIEVYNDLNEMVDEAQSKRIDKLFDMLFGGDRHAD